MPAVDDLVLWHDAIQRKGRFFQENAVLLVVLHVTAAMRIIVCRLDSCLSDIVLFFFCFFPGPALVLPLQVGVRIGLGFG